MIQEFVDRFMANKATLEEKYSKTHLGSYESIVRDVIEVISPDGDYDYPDPTRINVIDDGDYQGTLVFVIAGNGYQPNNYWYIKVYYGSCSGCDTLKGIRGYNDEPPTKEQVYDYMTLALHIVQWIRPMQ
jgi:hypothetical protein